MTDTQLRRARASQQLSEQTNPLSLPAARILWLRQPTPQDEKSRTLDSEMRTQGLQLRVVDAFSVTSDQLAQADLILLDAYSHVDGMVETIVSRIRFESRVPLIMLTRGYSTDELVTALTAGADAIWSVNTPVEILLARCKALLRRWLPEVSSGK